MTLRQQVLIVDDEPINVRILEQVLGTTAALRSVDNGEAAVAAAQALPPDLILLDIMMPGMDGYEVCRRVRSNPLLVHTRIILVSGKVTAAERLQGYRVGADDYIVKPYIPDELLAKVKVYLRLVSAERSLRHLNADLEEKVRLRSEQLVKAERAAFLGAHAAEIVHNLNNPLAVVMGNIRILSREMPSNIRIERASSGLVKIQEIIKTILQANKQDAPDAQDVHINEVLKDELKLLEIGTTLRHNVETDLDLGEIAAVKGQVLHFSQSFGNLIKNSIDAMHSSDRRVLRLSTRQKDSHIVVEIADTGVGIPAGNLSKIFDPFFTTKVADGKSDAPVGNGLGLLSVKRMLTACGASIEFESSVGVGTTARIKVPLRPVSRLTLAIAPDAIEQQGLYAPAALPVDEADRYKALMALQILDTPQEQIFEDLALLAVNVCQTPVAIVGFLDATRHWFKAAVGLGDMRESPRSSSFCAHTILGRAPFVVEDAALDQRFATNPLVIGPQHLRFYAGIPLIVAEGRAVGSLCVIDQVARRLTAQQMQCLDAISRQIVVHLERRKIS